MSEPYDSLDRPAVVIDPPVRVHEPEPQPTRPDVAGKLANAWLGICFAGAAYPFVGLMIWVLVSLFTGDLVHLIMDESGLAVVIGIGICLVGASMAGFVGAFALCLVGVVHSTLRLAVEPLILAGCTGGLTGFVCTWAVFGFSSSFPWRDPYWLETLVVFTLGPLLGTMFGQVGAVWAAGYPWRQPYRPIQSKRWQFSIRQVLVGTTWFAVALALVQLTPLATWDHAISLGMWLLFQYVSLMFVLWFFSWRGFRGKKSN